MRRRSFLAWIGGFAALVVARIVPFQRLPGPTEAAAEATPADEPFAVFTPEQATTMEAMLDRLLPSNVPLGTPGARETHVLRYLERQLAGARFPQYRDVLRDGAAALDDIARLRHAAAFHALGATEQDELLRAIQIGNAFGHPAASLRFFQVTLTLALEGHWGHPRYGGNYDRLAWRSVGIDPGCAGGMRACR
jgi:gluconate 2-dehydrogenase gamma chain